MDCCDRIIPASRAAEIARSYLLSEYRFVDPDHLTIDVIGVEYEACVWNVRLRTVVDLGSGRMTVGVHMIQVDACTGRVVGGGLEEHFLV